MHETTSLFEETFKKTLKNTKRFSTINNFLFIFSLIPIFIGTYTDNKFWYVIFPLFLPTFYSLFHIFNSNLLKRIEENSRILIIIYSIQILILIYELYAIAVSHLANLWIILSGNAYEISLLDFESIKVDNFLVPYFLYVLVLTIFGMVALFYNLKLEKMIVTDLIKNKKEKGAVQSEDDSSKPKKSKFNISNIGKNKLSNKERIEQLSKLLNISNRVKLSDIENILHLSRKQLISQLIEWTDQISGYKIDEDYLLIDNSGTNQEFINMVDQQFSDWDDHINQKQGKI
ncbi:hypothetical protein [Candidatus Lokiarchaeum ossiferum]|uniref:hypothetical protein n=1 Tax=Candidatus Lokiarchaeum ossiferum TaxID=2951803 RepID=UPI00352E88BB